MTTGNAWRYPAGCYSRCCREMYHGATSSSRVSVGTHRHLPVAALMLCADVLLCVCTADQMSAPTCTVLSVMNAEVENRTYQVGEVLGFQCLAGYHLDFHSSHLQPRCRGDGEWSSVPKCISNFVMGRSSEVGAVETCPEPSPPDHGGRLPSSPSLFHEGALIRFHCQHGYKLRGPPKAECERQEDGTLAWEPSSAPQCLPEWTECPLPSIEDADVYNITYRPGDRLIISCHQGFQIRYPDMDIMAAVCPEDGTWDNLPSCQGCLRPRVFPHSYVNVSDSLTTFPVGSVLRYQCFPGYKLSGPELLECTYNLLWSAGPPGCLDVEACPLPPIPSHGDYLCHPYPCDRYIHGTVLEFYCDPGYSLATDYKYVTCQHGDWFPASQVFCQTIGQSWADSEDSILSTWKVVAFTAISVLLALLLLVFLKAFQIRLKSPCQSGGEAEGTGSQTFVVVEGVPVTLPTYEEAVCSCSADQPDPQLEAPAAQGEQVLQTSDQNPPAYPGRITDPLLAANPVAPVRPGQLECAGAEEREGSSPSMSFGTAATHPMTEETGDSPATGDTVSTSPSLSVPDGAA
ncbi:sushi domain-containing protein 4 [Pristis pectinata]|uniref:sushi domain-containing protein 4 n=1 Tax=Pristis pectinata TaxID=685728 RepID=UPI00223E0077|nr:sushi domain-containing protein 4 [Pristis pectinata]